MTRYSHLLFRLYQTVDPSSITKIIEKLPKRDKEIGLVSISKASPTVELTPTKIKEILSITEKNNLVINIQHTDFFKVSYYQRNSITMKFRALNEINKKNWYNIDGGFNYSQSRLQSLYVFFLQIIPY